MIFNKKVSILIRILLKFVPEGQFNNKAPLIWLMAQHQSGDKPLPYRNTLSGFNELVTLHVGSIIFAEAIK